jgi:hypothetical protein
VVFHGHSATDNIQNTIVVGNTISGNGADTNDALTAGTTGINFFGAHTVSPLVPGGLSGTQIYGNTISNEDDAISYNSGVPLMVHFNNLINVGNAGVNNTDSTGLGSVDASQNYWGCSAGPTNTGCSSVGGTNVTTSPYLPATAAY